MILILLGGRVSSYCHLWLVGGYEQTFHLVIDEGIRNSITFMRYFFGDCNKILNASEKEGCATRKESQLDAFREAVDL